MLYNLERAWDMYTLLEATEWKWPPDVLDRQEYTLMHDVLVLKFADNRVKEMKRKD